MNMSSGKVIVGLRFKYIMGYYNESSKDPWFHFCFEHEGIHLNYTLASMFQGTIFFPLLLYLACWNEVLRSAADNGLFCQFWNKMQTTCTFRTYIGTLSAHSNFNVLLSCAHWTSANMVPGLIKKEPRGHFLPYLDIPLLIWELCTTTKGECRESSGNRANRRGFNISMLCLSVKRKHYVQTSQQLFIHRKPQVHHIGLSQHPLQEMTKALCNACACFVCTIAAWWYVLKAETARHVRFISEAAEVCTVCNFFLELLIYQSKSAGLFIRQ